MEILIDKNIVGDAARPFETIEQMNQALLDECNSRARAYVKRVPVLGDNGKPKMTFECQTDEN